jgi:stearoyl-CoA desaturase (delta-9 desaturase)
MATNLELRTVPQASRRPAATLVATFVGVTLPPLVIAAGIAGLWGIAVGPVDVALLVVFYTLTALGVSVGFHRLFTHRSFETTTALRVLWAVLGSLALQGPVLGWVCEHRKHLAHSDQEGDPHSPHVGRVPGLRGRIRGLWHSHMGWFFTTKGKSHASELAPDLLADRSIRTVDRLYPLWVVATFGLPFLAGLALTLSLAGALQALVWAGFARIFLYHHATWSVNSICHSFGTRRYLARDESRNNWMVSALTFGEGFHNNHHAFPSSAMFGLDRRQVDLGGLLIRGLERLHLAWDVKCPNSEQRARRRLSAQP